MLPLWEDNGMATSDRNLVTLCEDADSSVKRVPSSNFFFKLPNATDSDKRSEKLSREEKEVVAGKNQSKELNRKSVSCKKLHTECVQ